MNGFVSAAALFGLAVALVPVWFFVERRGWLGASDMPAILAATLLTGLISVAAGVAFRAVQQMRLQDGPEVAALSVVAAAPFLWLLFLGWMSGRSARGRGGPQHPA